MTAKLAIIVTYFNCLDYTKAMVESIKTSYPYELILIDDFSYDGSKTWAKKFSEDNSNVTLLEDLDTISLGQKWNLGVQKAKDLGCEVALVCNNDILFSPVTIDSLMRRWENRDAVLVSAHNLRATVSPKEILTYIPSEDAYSEAPHPDFSCFLMDIAAWEFIGKFPEIYVPCYFEDNHIHTMINAYGMKAIATTSAPYYHYGSITQNQVPDGLCKGPQFEANRDRFTQIFGATPDKVDLDFVRQRFNITPINSTT